LHNIVSPFDINKYLVSFQFVTGLKKSSITTQDNALIPVDIVLKQIMQVTE